MITKMKLSELKEKLEKELKDIYQYREENFLSTQGNCYFEKDRERDILEKLAILQYIEEINGSVV